MIHGGEEWDEWNMQRWLYYDELDSWMDNPEEHDMMEGREYYPQLYTALGKLTEDLSWV